MQVEPQYLPLANPTLEQCQLEMPEIIYQPQPQPINGVQQTQPQTNIIIDMQQSITAEQLALKYVQDLKIPNIISFTHNYEGKFPCCCGTIKEWSRITVEPLGFLDTGYDGCYCCCVPCLSCIRCCLRCIRLMNCDYHVFHRADYISRNSNVSLEYWQSGMGKVKVNGVPVLNFVQTHPNCWDALCGHVLSSYPKLEFSWAFGNTGNRITLQPDRSYLPETIFSIPAFLAPFGIFQHSRQFTVQGITGTCKITNTRTCMQACAKIYLVQGVCNLPHVDYPYFKIEFSDEVPQLDRLAVLMGLVHYTIFKKWYVMTVVRENISGVA